MSATTDLLDEAQSRLGLTSDNQLAQALGWLQPTVSAYRAGRRCMDVERVAEFSAKTGIPLERVVAAAIEDRRRLKSHGRSRKGQITLPLETRQVA